MPWNFVVLRLVAVFAAFVVEKIYTHVPLARWCPTPGDSSLITPHTSLLHDQLVAFDGQGHFTLSRIQAVPVLDPPALDNQQSLESHSNDDTVSSGIEVVSLPAQPVTYLTLLRLCFFDKESSKNMFLHLIILVVFTVSCFLTVVWQKNTIGGAIQFPDSANFFLEFILIALVAPSVIQTIVNALIAYSSLRTRKTLCRGMHKLYFSANRLALH